MAIDLTGLRDVLFALIIGVLSVTLVPYLRAKAGEVKWAEIIGWIKVAVNAAEMVHQADPGAVKKEYAQKVLEAAGIDPGAVQVDAAIEAEVYTLKAAQKPDIEALGVINNP
jgi:hypothetical protein